MLAVEDEDEDPVFLRKICVQRKIIVKSITVLIFFAGDYEFCFYAHEL